MNSEQQNLIEELYLNFYPYLYMYAMRLLKDEYLAEDAVHESFKIACLRADVLISSANSKGWMVNTLKNVVFEIWRSQKKQYRVYELMDKLFDGVGLIENEESIVDLYYSDMLKAEEYKMLKKYVFEGYSLKEISAFGGISAEACKKRFQRTKRKLRNKIKEIEE